MVAINADDKEFRADFNARAGRAHDLITGDSVDFGGLLGSGPVMPVREGSPEVFINRGGRIPAPIQALKN